MTAYDKKSIDALEVRKYTQQWFNAQLIDEAEKNNIFNSYLTKFKVTTLFAKIGMFIFTFLGALFSSGIISGLIGIGGGLIGAGIVILIFSGISTFILEQMILNKNLYRSGVDNALIYFSSWAAIIGLSIIINKDTQNWGTTYFLAFLIFVAYSIRYTDVITTILAYISLFCFFYILLAHLGFSVIPFSFMVISGVFYFLAKTKLNDEKFKYWRKCLQTVTILSLLSFYMAGNYFIVRKAMEELMHVYLEQGENIPLSIVFYIFTAIVPLFYIYWALRTKDRILLIVGLIITAAAALTFKYYFSLGHPEILLTAVGVLLISIAYASIKYLSEPKYGLTYKADNRNYKELEALVIVQSFKPTHPAPGNDVRFGGGEFDGGGAGSNF